MRNRIYWIVAIVLLLSFALVACIAEEEPDTPADAVVEEQVAETTEEEAAEEEVAEQPAEEEAADEATEIEAEAPAEEAQEFSEADLDAAYSAFLASMVKYNTTGLDALNEQLAGDPPPFVLDVRQPEELEEKGHIEGAVHIPLRELGKNIDLLPSYDTPIVAYCGSGWRCTIAMTALGAMGWEDVLSLKGGSFGGWVEAGYPVVEGAAAEAMVLNAVEPDPGMLAVMDEMFSTIPEGWGGISAEQLNIELAENPELIVIDVRRQDEVDSKGRIEAENYIHIPLEQFVERKAEWPTDKAAPIAVYCGSGHRSTMAMPILSTYGYEDVRSLKGGFGGWADAGYPVTGGAAALDEAYNNFLANMVKYNTTGLDALNEQLAGDPPPSYSMSANRKN
jgi:rhodanese-related sulfurtransferase